MKTYIFRGFEMNHNSLLIALSGVMAVEISFADTVKAQENTAFPLVSMEIRIVPEQAVCRLPDGYKSISSQFPKCPSLDFDKDIKTLRGRNVKTDPSPPNQEVSLGDLSDLLGGYREELIGAKGGELSLGKRKSALLILDFGDLPQNPKAYDISIEGIQKGKGCRSQDLPESKWSYSSQLPAGFRYSFYHVKADYIIPCSSVTWSLTAKEQGTDKIYAWTFKTAR
jgi:hypothetical protein